MIRFGLDFLSKGGAGCFPHKEDRKRGYVHKYEKVKDESRTMKADFPGAQLWVFHFEMLYLVNALM